MAKKQSAGLLVYRHKGGQLEVLIAHWGGPFHTGKDAGHWTIPKGEYSAEEDPKNTAKREFEEELGKPAPQGIWIDLGSVEQRNQKIVRVWAVEGDLSASDIKSNTFKIEWPPRSSKIQEFPEVESADWFSLNEAAQKLHPAQVEFLHRLAEKLGPKQNSLF